MPNPRKILETKEENQNFICPITFEQMIDPVILVSVDPANSRNFISNGMSYERSAVASFNRNGQLYDPINPTEILLNPFLIPNTSLKKAIEQGESYSAKIYNPVIYLYRRLDNVFFSIESYEKSRFSTEIINKQNLTLIKNINLPKTAKISSADKAKFRSLPGKQKLHKIENQFLKNSPSLFYLIATNSLTYLALATVAMSLPTIRAIRRLNSLSTSQLDNSPFEPNLALRENLTLTNIQELPYCAPEKNSLRFIMNKLDLAWSDHGSICDVNELTDVAEYKEHAVMLSDTLQLLTDYSPILKSMCIDLKKSNTGARFNIDFFDGQTTPVQFVPEHQTIYIDPLLLTVLTDPDISNDQIIKKSSELQNGLAYAICQAFVPLNNFNKSKSPKELLGLINFSNNDENKNLTLLHQLTIPNREETWTAGEARFVESYLQSICRYGREPVAGNSCNPIDLLHAMAGGILQSKNHPASMDEVSCKLLKDTWRDPTAQLRGYQTFTFFSLEGDSLKDAAGSRFYFDQDQEETNSQDKDKTNPVNGKTLTLN